MKVLIIGSNGFIGSHLVEYLARKNYVVYKSDINDDSSSDYCKLSLDNVDYDILFNNVSFDYCINCSGAASVQSSIENPQNDFELNTINVFKILNSIKKNQPKCIFFNLSSAAVYGNPVCLPIYENHQLNPLSPYGYHKFYSEKILEEFKYQFGIATCSLRIFSAYGEGLKKQLFWDLAQKIKNKDKVLLFGTGKETRDFIYIQDLVSAIEVCIRNFSGDIEIINIASGVEVSIFDAVESFYSNYNFKVNFEFTGDERSGDPINWVANIDQLKRNNFKPVYSINEGLKKYYKWINSL